MLCFAGQNCLGRCVGKVCRATGAEHVLLYRDHGRIGRAVKLPVQACSVSADRIVMAASRLPCAAAAHPASRHNGLQF